MAPKKAPVWLIDSHAYLPPKEYAVRFQEVIDVWQKGKVGAKAGYQSTASSGSECAQQAQWAEGYTLLGTHSPMLHDACQGVASRISSMR